jgi:P4 family phage/plasmid primase-like protien
VQENERAARFAAIFRGSERSHGLYTPDETQAGGKQKGTALTKSGPAILSDWQEHLAGRVGVGIVALLDDGTCHWGAVDIDVYDLDHAAVATALLAHRIPAIVARSRSGGVHVLLFAKEAIPAGVMQGKLRELAALLGYPSAEIFPKQSEPTESGGNWLNIAYFGDARYAVSTGGDPLTADEFLDRAEASKMTLEWFRTPLPVASAAEPAARRKKPAGMPAIISEGGRDNALASAAGKMRRAGFGPTEILAALREMNQERCQPPLSDADVSRIAQSIGKKQPTEDADTGLTNELATAITATDFFARDAGKRLYHWEGGTYQPTAKQFIETKVKTLCIGWGKTKSWNPELPGRVEQWIMADAPQLWDRPSLDVLNCANGLLDVVNRTLRPHSPEYLSPIQIAANFDPGAECPHIDKFIRDVFPEDTLHLPAEITAWLMLPGDTSIQKAVLLLGEGANGKSVLLNLLLTFLGHKNVSTISLHRLEADKFSVARLVGKVCNIGTDLPTAALAGTSMLKALTGGDVISAERKYEASFEFRPFVRLLFSANSAPRSDDPTHGFFRRWLVIPFSKTFDESDPATVPRAVLDAKLSEPGELSGLLIKALDALPVIRKGRFTESASTRAALDEFRRTTDPLSVWLDRFTVERPDAIIAKEKLRGAYGQVCQEAGRPVMGDMQFAAALKRARPKVEHTKRRVDGRPTPVYVGLGMVSFDEAPSMF